MSRKPKLPELDLRDRLVLTKLVRFAVLDANHVAEEYGLSPGARSRRFEWLIQQGFVVAKGWLDPLRVYVPTSMAVVALGLGKRPEPMYEQIAVHHLAVVDLADVLLASDPMAGWRTERELSLDRMQEDPYSYGRRSVHRPDGLLLQGDKRVGIELELNRKSKAKYAEICRWYGEHVEVDELRWYANEQAIRTRITHAIDEYGLTDLDIHVLPFPRGVRDRGC